MKTLYIAMKKQEQLLLTLNNSKSEEGQDDYQDETWKLFKIVRIQVMEYVYLQTVTYPDIFWEYHFQQGISGQEPYKHVWTAWVGFIYYGKCNYSVLINCIRHCVTEEFIQNYLKILCFLLIWGKNLGSHTN